LSNKLELSGVSNVYVSGVTVVCCASDSEVHVSHSGSDTPPCGPVCLSVCPQLMTDVIV